MTDLEAEAHELVRRKEWVRAIELYDQLLGGSNNGKQQININRERVVACLLGRSECCLELGRHEAVVSDCRRIIKLLADGNEQNNSARARRRLVHALFSLRRFSGKIFQDFSFYYLFKILVYKIYLPIISRQLVITFT